MCRRPWKRGRILLGCEWNKSSGPFSKGLFNRCDNLTRFQQPSRVNDLQMHVCIHFHLLMTSFVYTTRCFLLVLELGSGYFGYSDPYSDPEIRILHNECIFDIKMKKSSLYYRLKKVYLESFKEENVVVKKIFI